MGFCKIDGIKGDSKIKGFEDQIEVLRFEHKVRQPASVSASGRGGLTIAQAEHSAFYIVHELDPASPLLLQAASDGRHIAKVEVTLCRQAGEEPIPYMKYAFEDVLVESLEPAGDMTGDGLPEERVGFAYGKIEATHTGMDTTGKKTGQVVGSFDRRKGTK
jgi:type VI secretion system secreted protein Hcp